MAICMVLRFHIPNLGFSGTMAYYLIVLMSFSIGFTMACVPGQALISVLSTDYNKRNILMTIRALSGTVLGAIVSIAALPSVNYFGGGAKGWEKFVLCTQVLAVICIYIYQRGMRRVDYPGAIATPEHSPLLKRMFSLLKCKPVLCVSLATALNALTLTLSGVCSMHFYDYVLGDVNILTEVSAYSLPIAIICPLLTPFILKKIDKKWMLVAGFVISLIKPAVIMLLGEDITVPITIVLILISRVGQSFFGSAFIAWVPECVDFVYLEHGAVYAALISAIVTFMQKCGRALGQGLAGILLDVAGFQGGTEITTRALHEILRINGLYQIIGLCLAVIPISLFPISRRQGEEIRRRLHERDGI